MKVFKSCQALSILTLLLLSLSPGIQAAQAEDAVDEIAAGAAQKSVKKLGKTTKVVVYDKKEGGFNYAVGSVDVDAPQAKVWELITDYNHANLIFGNLKKCEVVGTEGDTKLLRQLVQPRNSIVKFDYVVGIKETCPSLITWSRIRGSLKECKGAWEFAPLKTRGTRVTYSIYIDGGMWLPAWLLHNQVRGYLPVMLKNLKDRAESQV